MKKLFLSAAFIAFGTLAMAQTTPQLKQKDPAAMQQKREDKLKMMQSELNLSNDQVARIRELQDKKMAERAKMTPEIQAARKAKMDQWKAKKEQMNAQMKEILTPEQYAKWEAKKQERMNKKPAMMKDHQMKKMPVK